MCTILIRVFFDYYYYYVRSSRDTNQVRYKIKINLHFKQILPYTFGFLQIHGRSTGSSTRSKCYFLTFLPIPPPILRHEIFFISMSLFSAARLLFIYVLLYYYNVWKLNPTGTHVSSLFCKNKLKVGTKRINVVCIFRSTFRYISVFHFDFFSFYILKFYL